MSARAKFATRSLAEVTRERNALLKCVERMAEELDRQGNADDTITEDGRNTVRWCKVRENARKRDARFMARVAKGAA